MAEWADLLGGCARFAENYRRANGFLPTSSAPITRYSGELYDPLPAAGYDLAQGKLAMVEDMLQALSLLFSPHAPTVFAPQVLMRSILEGSAAAWYLLDPSVDGEVLASRYLNEQINNTRRVRALAQGHAESVTKFTEHLAGFFSDAEKAGLSIVRDRKGHAIGVGEPIPEAGQLVDLLWESIKPKQKGKGPGRLLYRLYSGPTHAQPSAFIISSEIEPDSEGRRRANRTRVSLFQYRTWTVVAAASWAHAFDRYVTTTGWDADTWQGWKDRVEKVTGKVEIPDEESVED